jgi:hypothetical protein
MDFSKISTKDLEYLNKNQLDKVSTAGLEEYQRQMAETQPVASQETTVVEAKKPTSIAERFATGFKEPFLGMGQIASQVTKSPQAYTANPLLALTNLLGQKSFDIGLKATGQKPSEQAINQEVANTAKNYVAPEGIDWARMAGNVLNPTTFVAPETKATSLLGKVATGAGVGAGYSALTPVNATSPEDFYAQKANQMAGGAAVGSAFPLVGSALARVISPKASTNVELQKLKEMGVTPTLGQTLGGRANLFEEKASQIPFIGDVIAGARTNNETKFREGIYNSILSNVDEKLPQNLTGRDPLRYTKQKLQANYDNILDKVGAIKVDDTFVTQANELSDMLQKSGLGAEEINKFNYLLNPIKNAQNDAGYITSTAFKKAQSDITKQASKLKASSSIFENDIGKAADQLNQNLQGMLERHAAQIGEVDGKNLANELAKTDKAWAMFKRTEQAAEAIGAPSGEFTPAQFSNAVRKLERQKGKYAAGEALLQDVSDAGKNVLANKISNATPWIKTLFTGAAGAGLYGATLPTLAGLTGGAALTYGLYNPASKKIINTLLTERPDLAPTIANAINQNAGRLGVLAPSLLGSE